MTIGNKQSLPRTFTTSTEKIFNDEQQGMPIVKAGIVPFYRSDEGALQYYVYKPAVAHEHLPAPKFQIAKGTRKIFENDEWRDVAPEDFDESGQLVVDGELEAMADTAVREGREEIGLQPNNISELIDLGVAAFTSESKGKTKYMHMFSCEVRDKEDFATPKDAKKTQDRKWEGLSWFRTKENGRDDNVPIMEAIEAALLNRNQSKRYAKHR